MMDVNFAPQAYTASLFRDGVTLDRFLVVQTRLDSVPIM